MSGQRWWSPDQLLRYAMVLTGVVVVVMSVAVPWYQALAVNGSSVMSGWGVWSVPGIDADLVKFPAAVVIWLPAAVMVVAAVQQRYGVAALSASLVAVLGFLAYAVRDMFATHHDGGGAVYVEVLAGPRWVQNLGLLATVFGWFLYSRLILRARATT